MCSVHGSVCHDGQVLPKDPGAGGHVNPLCFPYLVLRNCSRLLVYRSGGAHRLVSRCYCFTWQGFLALVAEGYIFFYFGLISRSARDNPIMGRANVNVATRAAAKSDHRILNFLVHGTTLYGGMCTALLQKGSSKM